MTKTIIKAGGARDFLSLVPNLIGYTPEQSLVLIPFKASRSLGAMRFDLPTPDDDLITVASTMVGMVCRLEDADGVTAIVYSTTLSAAETEPLLGAVLSRAEECGLRAIDLLYVAADGWGSVIQQAPPAPLSELTPHPDAPGTVAQNQHADALPEVSMAFMMEVTGAIEDVHLSADPMEWVPIFEAIADTEADELSGDQVVLLIAAMDRPALRDIALMQWGWGEQSGIEAAYAQLGWERGMEYPESAAMRMWGQASRPQASRLEHALAAVRLAAAVIESAGSLAACAWLSWALGRSTHADDYAKQGMGLEPDHGLCGIVASYVRAGHLPDWAFSK